jgi:hypothetical protein
VTGRRWPWAALAALVLVAGCGGGRAGETQPRAPAPRPTDGTGYFVGTGPGGLGAAVDLLGDDPAARAVAAALAPARDPGGLERVVAIASVVNDGADPAPVPRIVAELSGGGAAPLVPAREALRGVGGAAARRAARLLPPERRRVPAGGALTMHLVMSGANPREVTAMRMVVVPGEPIALRPQRR